jgi:hypothetical protein
VVVEALRLLVESMGVIIKAIRKIIEIVCTGRESAGRFGPYECLQRPECACRDCENGL